MGMWRRLLGRLNKGAPKHSLAEFARRFAAVVQRCMPGTERVDVVVGRDPAEARVVSVNAQGHARTWFVYPAYAGYLKNPAALEEICERYIRASLDSVVGSGDADEERPPRNATEVAQRLLALSAVISRAREDVATGCLDWVRAHGIEDWLSEAERQFFFLDRAPDAQAVRQFSWRAEAMVPMIWALGGMVDLPPLDRQVDVWESPLLREAVATPASFVAGATLRSIEEISERENHLHEQHWRVRDAQLHRRPVPAGLDAEIVYERRYALSWLVGYGQDWDDVPTDT